MNEHEAKSLVNQLLHGRMACVPPGFVEVTEAEAARRGLSVDDLDQQGQYSEMWRTWLILDISPVLFDRDTFLCIEPSESIDIELDVENAGDGKIINPFSDDEVDFLLGMDID